MKKILFLISVGLALAYTPKAQVTFSHTATNPTGTITNTGIDTSTYVFTKGYPATTFALTMTRTSGTAAGTAILEWKLRSTDNYRSDAGDTLTVANSASQTLIWKKTHPARYWRVRTGGATTVVATASVGAQVVN